MHAVADTKSLVEDGILSEEQAASIIERSRHNMVILAINTLLIGGILAATGGLIFWLADALYVAIGGAGAVLIGSLILTLTKKDFRMFGTAASLIGAGMLIGGAGIELAQNFEEIAGQAMIGLGVVVALLTGLMFRSGKINSHFVNGAMYLMGTALYLAGAIFLFEKHDVEGFPVSIFSAATAMMLAFSGWFLNVRFVTALAILPFAQILDTSVFYQHALYAFYSPEATLTIVQMIALIGACFWFAKNTDMRHARHAMILAVMAFVVVNLSALVGALNGDVVGEYIWGPGWSQTREMTYADWSVLRDEFRADALVIPRGVFSIGWAVALAGAAGWAAHTYNRGLFYTALTFGGIHAYTQMFEQFGDEPLAFVVGGFAAIPLAWGMWRLNDILFSGRSIAMAEPVS